MENLMNLKKNKKGFTLVEVIVVLVILAILAAILVPSLTGYIDKANDKVAIAEARAVLMAAQTLASEAYGTTGKAPTDTGTEIVAFAEVSGSITTDVTYKEGKVQAFTYKSEAEKVVNYTVAGGLVVAE